MNKYPLLFFFILSFSYWNSQNENGLSLKLTFNKGEAINEINHEHIKTSSVLYVEDRFGNSASACYLHGSPGSYVNLGSGPEVKPIKGTISMWFKVDLIMFAGMGIESCPILLAKNGDGDDFWEAYHLSYAYNFKRVLAVTTLSEEKQIQLSSKDTLVLRKWHHVAMTFDDDSLKFYVNGMLNASIAKGFRTFYSNTDSVMVGNISGKKNQRFLCGGVDDILIYDRVLSSEEIFTLYNASDPNQLDNYLNTLFKILGVIVVIIILTWIIIRRQRIRMQKEIEKTRTTARLHELETKAMRAQMNPHFIFNSLNTLQRFILEDDTANAHLYLTKFSELLRRLLESGTEESISLKEEIEILTAYVEIEKLRFGDSFDFIIQCDIVDTTNIFIPLMLIQPLVENAIWHGLLPKGENELLKINFIDLNEETILCQIDDNGVGRGAVYQQKSGVKKKSLALDFIRQRLEILEKVTGIKGSLTMIDKKDEGSQGTLVELIIPKIK